MFNSLIIFALIMKVAFVAEMKYLLTTPVVVCGIEFQQLTRCHAVILSVNCSAEEVGLAGGAAV